MSNKFVLILKKYHKMQEMKIFTKANGVTLLVVITGVLVGTFMYGKFIAPRIKKA